jgi:hypothetical protein
MSTTFDNKKQDEILKRDGLGRLRTSRERREAILDDFEASAMSGVGYARQHGINYTTFANWIQKRRRLRGDYDKTKSPAKIPAMELTLAEVVIKNSPPPGGRHDNNGLRVELPGGAALLVDNAGQVAMAAELIRLVNQSK